MLLHKKLTTELLQFLSSSSSSSSFLNFTIIIIIFKKKKEQEKWEQKVTHMLFHNKLKENFLSSSFEVVSTHTHTQTLYIYIYIYIYIITYKTWYRHSAYLGLNQAKEFDESGGLFSVKHQQGQYSIYPTAHIPGWYKIITNLHEVTGCNEL